MLPSSALEPIRPRHSAAAFVRHLVEMLVAMAVGMTVLGMIDGALLRAAGLAGLRDQALIDLVLMSLEMTTPMAAWMVVRGHHRRDTIEMSGSMLVPAAVLVALGLARLLSPMDAEMAYHPAMLAAMVGLMVVRRDVYAVGHHEHGRGHGAHLDEPETTSAAPDPVRPDGLPGRMALDPS